MTTEESGLRWSGVCLYNYRGPYVKDLSFGRYDSQATSYIRRYEANSATSN